MSLSRRALLAGSAAAVGVAGLRIPAAAAGRSLADAYGTAGVPRGRALGLTSSGGRVVTWLTTGGPTPQLLEWGTGGRLAHRVSATTSPAPMGQFDEDTGTSTPIKGERQVQVHRAALAGVAPGTTVSYRVGHPSTGWSPVARTNVRRADDDFVLAHFGDHGVTAASRRTSAAIRDRSPDAVLLTGDISYANGFQPTWDRWAGLAEPMTSVVPLLPVPGNHEAKDFYGGTYRSRFTTPAGAANWWTADLGRAFVFAGTAGCFLTENDPTTARDLVVDELVAMERTLAAAAARRAAGEVDFLVVAQHFPLYTNHESRGPFSPQLVAAQEHILQRYQVDLVLVGHDHMYQRSVPMAYGQPTEVGLGYVQVCAGAGGNGLYDFMDPAAATWGRWCASYARRWSFAEHRIQPGRIDTQVLGWNDRQATAKQPDPDAVDPREPLVTLDRFSLERKAPAVVAVAAAKLPRAAHDIVAGVPEAHGVVVRNLAEDCTRH